MAIRLKSNAQNIWKPLVTGVGGVLGVSAFLLAGCLFYDYQSYLSKFRDVQKIESEALKKDIDKVTQSLVDLATLTRKRILSYGSNVKRISDILDSTYRFSPNTKLPAIKKVFYTKLTHPMQMITRFGVILLDLKTETFNFDSSRVTDLFVNERHLIIKEKVVNSKGNIEGILGIEVEEASFKKLFSKRPTLIFKLVETGNSIFEIKQKPPMNFLDFIEYEIKSYLKFMLLTTALMVLFGFMVWHLQRRTWNFYETTILDLENLKATLLANQVSFESQCKSNQAQSKFLSSILTRQKNCGNAIHTLLNVIIQSLADSSIHLSDKEHEKILKSCVERGKVIADGNIENLHKDEIDLNKIINELKLLFAAEIHKNAITLDVKCPNRLQFQGDQLFIQFILINFIGKPIHRAPRFGKVSVIAIERDDSIIINIQDKGYELSDGTDVVNNSFEFFVTDDELRQMCGENGIYYERSKSEEGTTLVEVRIPPFDDKKGIPTKVVKLYG